MTSIFIPAILYGVQIIFLFRDQIVTTNLRHIFHQHMVLPFICSKEWKRSGKEGKTVHTINHIYNYAHVIRACHVMQGSWTQFQCNGRGSPLQHQPFLDISWVSQNSGPFWHYPETASGFRGEGHGHVRLPSHLLCDTSVTVFGL